MTIPIPVVSTVFQQAPDPMDSVLSAALRSPQVIAAAAAVRTAKSMGKSGRATTPGQLTIAPWLGSPNGTTEEFLFIQSLEAGGRRAARVSSHDVLILDAQANYNETVVAVYAKILVEVANLVAAERSYFHASQVEKNLAESLRVIQTQVTAGTKPGSDLELAKAMWNEARIESKLAFERTKVHHINLKSYGIEAEASQSAKSVLAIPDRASLFPGNSIDLRGAANAARLNADMHAFTASGRPDLSVVVRSQNFTRNFTPNDRGLALQVSIPIDHGTIRANAATIQSQIISVDLRLKDDRSKQESLRSAIDANIARLDAGIATTQETVITPLSNYVSKMQRAYMAGTVTVLAFLDAQRSYHDAERKLIALRDQRDMAILQLIEQGGMIPKELLSSTKQSDRK